MIYKNKTLLITDDTSSFGNTVLKIFLDTDIAQIRIFSRDERTQDEMLEVCANPKIYIGHVRDCGSQLSDTRGFNYVYHYAAELNQVPSCEFNSCR